MCVRVSVSVSVSVRESVRVSVRESEGRHTGASRCLARAVRSVTATSVSAGVSRCAGASPRVLSRGRLRPSTLRRSPPRGTKSRVLASLALFLRKSFAPDFVPRSSGPVSVEGQSRPSFSKGPSRCSPRPRHPSTDSSAKPALGARVPARPPVPTPRRPLAALATCRAIRPARPRVDLRPAQHRRGRGPFHASGACSPLHDRPRLRRRVSGVPRPPRPRAVRSGYRRGTSRTATPPQRPHRPHPAVTDRPAGPDRHCEGPLRPNRPEAISRPRNSVRTSRTTTLLPELPLSKYTARRSQALDARSLKGV